MQNALHCVMQIVPDIWPTWATLADEIGCPYPTVHSWARRGIPFRRFPALIRAASARGIILTYEQLASSTSPQEDAA